MVRNFLKMSTVLDSAEQGFILFGRKSLTNECEQFEK
jgi:hypothetical protein